MTRRLMFTALALSLLIWPMVANGSSAAPVAQRANTEQLIAQVILVTDMLAASIQRGTANNEAVADSPRLMMDATWQRQAAGEAYVWRAIAEAMESIRPPLAMLAVADALAEAAARLRAAADILEAAVSTSDLERLPEVSDELGAAVAALAEVGAIMMS